MKKHNIIHEDSKLKPLINKFKKEQILKKETLDTEKLEKE